MSAPAWLRAAFAAAAILAIGMGFGRFAFTAIYPHIRGEGALTLRYGSLAASANYAGYLLGAILAMRARAHGAHRLCLGVLALPMPVWLFVTVRGVAGVFSALAMVAASLWLLVQRRHVAAAGRRHRAAGAGGRTVHCSRWPGQPG